MRRHVQCAAVNDGQPTDTRPLERQQSPLDTWYAEAGREG
jgi:hypothetical protein